MRHRLLSVLTLVSLLLAFALSALWLRSHFARDWLRCHWVGRGEPVRKAWVEVLTYPGVLTVTKSGMIYQPTTDGGFRSRLARENGVRWDVLPVRLWDRGDPGFRAQRFGFVYDHARKAPPATHGYTYEGTTVAAPFWALVPPTALPPLVWMARRLRRRRRRGSGLCPNCGYDLRESPERCPECGDVVKK